MKIVFFISSFLVSRTHETFVNFERESLVFAGLSRISHRKERKQQIKGEEDVGKGNNREMVVAEEDTAALWRDC